MKVRVSVCNVSAMLVRFCAHKCVCFKICEVLTVCDLSYSDVQVLDNAGFHLFSQCSYISVSRSSMMLMIL